MEIYIPSRNDGNTVKMSKLSDRSFHSYLEGKRDNHEL